MRGILWERKVFSDVIRTLEAERDLIPRSHFVDSMRKGRFEELFYHAETHQVHCEEASREQHRFLTASPFYFSYVDIPVPNFS